VLPRRPKAPFSDPSPKLRREPPPVLTPASLHCYSGPVCTHGEPHPDLLPLLR